jgi:hypothetical protein
MAEKGDSSRERDLATAARRATRAWERAAIAESRGARDPDGGLAFHWVAHSWRRCAEACEHIAPPDVPMAQVTADDRVADAWEAVAAAWEAAAAAWLAVAAAQRHLDASRAAEDRSEAAPVGGIDADSPGDDVVLARVAALAAARRVADERVRSAELSEHAARA